MPLPRQKGESQKKRLAEWKTWLRNFKVEYANNYNTPIKYIPNAAWLLNDMYWRLAEQYLRPILKTEPEIEEEHKIHPYKIISASEITVMMIEPVSVLGNSIDEKKLNSLLAWFVATQILEGWETGNSIRISAEDISKVALYKEPIDKGRNYPESFAAEHIQWLTMLNVTTDKPLLLNAQCWRAFYLACLFQAGTRKSK